MNSKIKSYSALALATAAVVPLACKKDSTTNDPNINEKTWNKVITAVLVSGYEYEGIDSIDVNNDGIFDFTFNIGNGTDPSDAYSYCAVYGNNSNNEFLGESVSGYTLLKALSTGTEVNSSQTTWGEIGYAAYLSDSPSFNLGNIKAGSGDKYVGFRFKVGSDTYYGWAKLNYAADKFSITLKETAYNKVAGSPITVGAE